MTKFKRFLAWLGLLTLMLQVLAVGAIPMSFAASVGEIAINEIAWAGSLDASGEEWIELYNNTNQEVDLSGWYIEDDGSTRYTIGSGVVPARGYFLIEDSENTTSVDSDALISLSLANAGDSLVLHDASGNVLDTVNGNGGAWYAGVSGSKATMERIDPSDFSDDAENWASASSGNGATSGGASAILGTPGSVNSNYGGSGPQVSITPSESAFSSGDDLVFRVSAGSVADLYAYGFEIIYDPSVLKFVSANEGNFLTVDGAASAFNAALENNTEGKVVVANARLVNPPAGIDGSGELFELNFEVVGSDGDASTINFGAGSFLSDSVGELTASLQGANVSVGQVSVTPVSNLQIAAGEELYSLSLSWGAPAGGADSYIVTRKGYNGDFVVIGSVSESAFVDSWNLIPGIDYVYQVVSVKNGAQSSAVEVSGKENRGIKGDNDRNGKVDGKDLERLARAFGSDFGDEEYHALIDTSFDGSIDGRDLIDIGLSFGLAA